MIEIDGAHGEGGGQLVRMAVALSALTAIPVRVVRIRAGGAGGCWPPPIDYFARVFLPLLRRLGGHIDVVVQRRGYYPRGGGIAEAVVQPTQAWSPIDASDPGAVRRVRGIAHVSNLPDDIPKRMAHAAVRRLHGIRDVKFEQRMYRGDEAIGQGGALVAWAETESALLGADSLAERGKPSDGMGEEVAAALRADLDSGAFLDGHAADQLLTYLARATGPSQFRVREISGHMETMMWLVPQLLSSRFSVARDGAGWRVSVEPKA